MDMQSLRQAIDRIDDEIARLFANRMDAVREIAEYKKEAHIGTLDSERERKIISRVTDIAGTTYAGYAKVLFSTLLDLSRSYQNQLLSEKTQLGKNIEEAAKDTSRIFPAKAVIACQGVEGAYSQLACDRLFSIPEVMYFSRFEGVFQAVESGLCRYGILPIENSAAGSVTAVYDLMQKYHFFIVRCLRLKIDHALLAKPGTALKDVREIVSHEQALSQCSDFLRRHPEIKVNVFENTAAAARYVVESDRTDLAAFASPNCAELYGLARLPVPIQNTDHNYTRFICISKNLEIYPGANKVSLLLSVSHTPARCMRWLQNLLRLG